MRKLFGISTLFVACVVLLFVAGPARAALLSDNFDDGNDDGWTRSDPTLWSVVGGEYVASGAGSGTTVSLRTDVTLPSSWVYDVDVKCGPGLQGDNNSSFGGMYVAEDYTNPSANYFQVNLFVHETQPLVSIQIHRQDAAWQSGFITFSTATQYHLTVSRAQGANVIEATLTGGGESVSLTSGDMTDKLASVTTPGLSAYWGNRYFDNVQLVVPEPASMTLLLLALPAILRRKTRK